MSELSGAGGIVPVGRIYVAGGRIRLPSILGLLLPEVGYRMRTQSYDELGNRLSRTSTNFTLYLRPAGFNIAYLFAPEPRFALELNIAPWIDIAFHGTPAQVGFSAFVQINAGMW